MAASMSAVLAPERLLADLQRLVNDQMNERRLYFWDGDAGSLRGLLASDPTVRDATEWLDVNDLAEDVLPRLAQRTLRSGLTTRLDAAVAAGVRLLVVDHPYLLLRYEPEAPLAALWDRFLGSSRTAIVILPPSLPRPPGLPPYVQYRAEVPRRLFNDAVAGAVLVAPRGIHT
jgi:hypothetical protein